MTVSQTLSALREAGFQPEENGNGQYVARRGSSIAVFRIGDSEAEILQAGRRLGHEIGALVSLGYQTVWRTAGGAERAARAGELEELHALLEDLREALGLTSLYNESLGSTHSLHQYDRAADRK
jgi:hypothetical protein